MSRVKSNSNKNTSAEAVGDDPLNLEVPSNDPFINLDDAADLFEDFDAGNVNAGPGFGGLEANTAGNTMCPLTYKYL